MAAHRKKMKMLSLKLCAFVHVVSISTHMYSCAYMTANVSLLKDSATLAHIKGSHTLNFLALLTSPSLQNNPSSKSATLNLRLSASNPPLRPLCVQLFVFAAEHKIGDDAGLCRGAAASVPIFHDGSGGRTLGFRRLLHYCCISSCKVSPASSTLPRPPALVGVYSFVPSAAALVNAFNFKTNSQITLD